MDTRDWNLCVMIYHTGERDKPTMDESSFVKLKHNPERLSACYKEVIDNIQELNELGDLPNFVVIANISGGDSTQSIVEKMMSNNVV